MEQLSQSSHLRALLTPVRRTWPFPQLARLWRQIMRRQEGERYLQRKYERIHNKPLNLTAPQTYTEKLFWRMITWNRGDMPVRFMQLTDKYAVRDYVAARVGERHLVKLLWQGTDPRAIPFDRLPNQYVIKPNHASGRVLVVSGHANRPEIIRTVSSWLAKNYYWAAREYQYYHIEPRIMIEEYLHDHDGTPPFDYKIHCFNGAPEHILVRDHRHDICPYFDTTWRHLDFSDKVDAVQPWVPKPANLDEMLSLARTLSEGFGYVRVDLYNVQRRVYFGELTFTPASGNLIYKPESWDLRHGRKWDLSLDVEPTLALTDKSPRFSPEAVLSRQPSCVEAR